MANKKNKQKTKKAPEQKQKTITKVPEQGKIVEAEVKTEKKATKDEKEPKSSRKPAKKKNKPNIFQRGIEFVKSTFKELKKVSWLTGEELAKSTGIVAGCVAVFTLITWLMDTGLGAMAAKLLGL